MCPALQSQQTALNWVSALERADFHQRHWRKSPQWSSLTRSHAELITRDRYVWGIISGPCAAMRAFYPQRNAWCVKPFSLKPGSMSAHERPRAA